MGIDKINAVLKEHIPEAFMSVPISKFRGKAIGFDASLWMYTAKSSAMKDVLRMSKDPLQPLDQDEIIKSMISQFYGITFKICSAGITPVWIFDGPKHPAKLAADRRKKKKDVKKICIDDERERLMKMDPLERSKEMDKFVKSLLSCFGFTRKEEDALKNEIQSLGIPMFIAPHDAEIFASSLSKKQLLLGVWTTDTDTYAAGALMKINGFSKGYSSEGLKVDITLVSIILDHFKITQDQLRDYCILHECDFNQRIPKLGPVTILKKMTEYDWELDSFMKTESDREWELLNVDECRSIFDGPNVDNISLKDLYIDRSKWCSHMRTKSFDIEIPPDPTIIDLL